MQAAQSQAEVGLKTVRVDCERFFEHLSRLAPLSQSLQRNGQIETADGIAGLAFHGFAVIGSSLFKLMALVFKITGGGINFGRPLSSHERLLNLIQRLF